MNNENPAIRKVTAHRINNANRQVEISVLDAPGHGGASHEYVIDLLSAPYSSDFPLTGSNTRTRISFQNGPLKESGLNGVTDEALLAVVIDRLQSFQKGPYSCRENALALTKMEEAMLWLHSRTRAREARGVEGTHAV